ncbi:hypothetical protein GCM10011344_34910 [Dokdonia pacifica]|nr:hypothetical protein [Dokdonia pacifica]GGG31005.1 hypothetical protein GCM10011344_34910 [Dokdonia pacifica]
MKNNTLIIILMMLISSTVFSQKEFERVANKLCKCIEKEKATTQGDVDSCLERTFAKNMDVFFKYYDAKTIDDIDMEEVGNVIGIYIAENCTYAAEAFMDEAGKESNFIEPAEDLTCLDIHQGEYYYTNEVKELNFIDTTYVSFNGDLYLERMKNGKTYSILDIEWINDCDFELTFKASNDPMKKRLSKPGDIYKYQIIDKTPTSIIIETFWNKRKYQVTFHKI